MRPTVTTFASCTYFQAMLVSTTTTITTSGAVSAFVVIEVGAVEGSRAASRDRAKAERTRPRTGDRLPRSLVEDLPELLLD